MDVSPTSGSPVCGEVEDSRVSIDYPQFSPPGASTSLASLSLPEPLLALPDTTSEQTTSHHGHCAAQSLTGSSQSTTDTALNIVNAHSGLQMEQPALNTLVLRAQHWEMLCRDLQKEKHVMEEQFGQQRKKFMNLMMQKDQELDTVKRSVEQFSGEAVRLNKLLRTKEEEVHNIHTITKAMESANREAFDADRVKYEEEIASLRRIIDVQCSEHKRERETLKQRDDSQLKRSPSPGDPSLENEMAKAVQESQVLKAVVVPLEEEIDHLRLQLSETKGRLQAAESVQQPNTPPLIDLEALCPSPLPENLSPSDNKLQRQLEFERTARHDLEMHTKVLEEQKTLLQGETVGLKKTVDDLNMKLTAQQESYQQLQQTWEMANQHFIVAQDKLRQQVYFMGQKQHLQQVPRDPSQDNCHPHSFDIPLGEQLRPSQKLTSRRHSLGDIRDIEGCNYIHISALESELKRVKQLLEQRSATCESYEAQLQRVQEQMLEELDEKDQELGRLREENSKARAGVMRERKAKEELRHKMEDTCEWSKVQVERYQADLQAHQAMLKSLKEQYTQSKHEAQRDLAKFSDERVSLFRQISSAQEEYDCLKVVQAEEAQQHTQQINEIKKDFRMAEDKAVALQLRLNELEQEKQAVEERLGAQLVQLKERLLLEQQAKEKQEFSLKRQLEAAANQIAALELVKTELGQEQQMKEEALAARSDVEEKSRNFIAEQHRKLESEVTSRQMAEQQVRELQRQITSLRSQLNTSQENQKDFVELSQALQVKLAQIEEEQQSSPPEHHL